MAGRMKHQCPNCAAPLAIPEQHERYFQCQYCGTVIGEADDGLEVASEDDAAGVVLVSYSRPKAGRWITFAFVLTLVLGFLPILLVNRTVSTVENAGPIGGSSQSGQSGQLDVDRLIEEALSGIVPGADGATGFGSITYAALVPSDDDSTPDVLAVGAGPQGATLVLADREAEGRVRWGVPMGDTTGGAFAVASADRVVAVSGDQLQLINRASGAVLGQATLSDEISGVTCPDCVQIHDDAVVALTTDGVLAAYELSDATQRWSVTLQGTPRHLTTLDGLPTVIDGAGPETELYSYALEDGAVAARTPATCEGGLVGEQEPPLIHERLLAVDGEVIVHSLEFDDACFSRWSTGATAPRWEARYPTQSSLTGLDVEHTLLTGGTLVYTGGSTAAAIDTATGEVTTLVAGTDSELFPIALGDGTAVVAAHSRRGSGSWQLLGIGLDGTQRWSYDLEAADALTLSPGGWAAEEAWFAAPTNGGVTVVTWRTEDSSLTFQTLPYGSGTATSPVTVQLPPSLIPRIEHVGQVGDSVLVTHEGTVLQIDVTDGSIERLL